MALKEPARSTVGVGILRSRDEERAVSTQQEI